MADKPENTDDTPTSTGESPVYDSIDNRPDGEPVVATVDSEPEVDRTPPPLVEPEEIVVDDSNSRDFVTSSHAYIDEPAAAEPERTADFEPVHEPVREPVHEPVREPEREFVEQPARDPEPTLVHDTRAVENVENTAPAAAPYPSQPQVVYVNAPQPPTDKGNRGFGVLIAIAATIVFQIVLAIVMAIVYSSLRGTVSLGFLGQTAFYVPALFFFIGFVALVLLLNRAGWWTYVIGSILVALVVYFGTIGALLLGSNIILQTPEVAAEQFRQGLSNPFTIAAALVAREIAIWAGAIVASRGRKVKARNIEAKAAFERERAQKRNY
jgi:hypothetical protein